MYDKEKQRDCYCVSQKGIIEKPKSSVNCGVARSSIAESLVIHHRRLKNGAWFGIDSNESARWKTSPSKNLSLYALAGVDGTVACAAGPRAALRGVAGIGTD